VVNDLLTACVPPAPIKGASMSTSSAVPSTVSTPLPTGTWKVDPIHSSVEFHVRHLGIATVKGQFNTFEGTLEVDVDGVHAHGTVDVASVDTRESQRDDHLRSADFFEVESFPQITFQSTAIRPLDDEELEIDADLTIHGVTRNVTLKATLEGSETDPQGNERIGVSARTQIDRGDFDIKFNAALGSGNLVVSDKVKILVEVSAVKQA
jgi:polyisoprenoid-binding protein YceI